MFKGSFAALITPFKNHLIDYESLDKLLNFHLENGTNGLVLCGTTGEGTSLLSAEKEKLIAFVLKAVNKKIPVVIGCSSPCLETAKQNVLFAQNAGADGVLIVMPYYIKPTQKGFIEYITHIHNQTSIPIILYNNPARTVVSLDVETVVQLCDLPRVVALKESSTDVTRISQLKARLDERLILFSGDDSFLPAHLLYGCDGSISVVANIIPKDYVTYIQQFHQFTFKTLAVLQNKILQTSHALFQDINPAGVKYALSKMNLCHNEVRLPLRTASPDCRKLIDNLLSDIGLCNIKK